ncbi:hypothetical protein AU210_016252 [Fusarium oxysporum f. sp. radicis-cucumerinum]|uniref:Uncharacterized protein n=1 Tax=Fusarium oxysporum f. sp. radicis-cucumerinum TaxID=327505 RepID=A0A2H3FR57_FUSOX|nr:hypothetical protein AU210_016252 [Fusarium oxysporum f. sp. radicis-cucumerinum]
MTICSPQRPQESSAAILCGSPTELSAIYKAFGVQDAEGHACRRVPSGTKCHFSDIGTCDIVPAWIGEEEDVSSAMEAKDPRLKHPLKIFVQTCDAVSLEGQGEVRPGDVLISYTPDYQKTCSRNTAEGGREHAIRVANFLASLRQDANTHGLSTMREALAEQVAYTRAPTHEQGSEEDGASRFLAPAIHLRVMANAERSRLISKFKDSEGIESGGPGTHSLSIIVQGVFDRIGAKGRVVCRETAAAGAARMSKVILQLSSDSEESGTNCASNHRIPFPQGSGYSSHVDSQVCGVTQGNRLTISSGSAAYPLNVSQQGSTFSGNIIAGGSVTQGNTMEFI